MKKQEWRQPFSQFVVCLFPWITRNFQWFLQKQRTNNFVHTSYKLIFRIMLFTDENIFFHDSLPQGFINNTILGNNAYDAFPPVATPFIVSLRYFENSNTRFSPRTWTAKNRAIISNHCYLIQEWLGIIWDEIDISYIWLKTLR